MKAYQLHEQHGGIEGMRIDDRPEPTPGPGEALIRMRAASLNYRDLLVAKDTSLYPGGELPMIPLCDGAGEIVDDPTGRFEPGDRVATPVYLNWVAGDLTWHHKSVVAGGNAAGTLAEFVTFPSQTLTALPSHLSYEEGATLGCAGLTAWNALVEHGDVKPGETVLVQGTGGVSTFGLQIGVLHAANVIVTSSSDEKLARAEEMGAWKTLNYGDTPQWHEAVREMTGGRGVDHVIEVGGPNTLERSMQSICTGGHIHVIGGLGGLDGQVSPLPIIMNAARVHGISVGSRAMFEDMCRALEAQRVTPVVDKVFPFEDAPEAYRYLASGAHHGKVVIRV